MDQRTGTVPFLFNRTQDALLVDVAIIKDIQEKNELEMRVLKWASYEKKMDKRK